MPTPLHFRKAPTLWRRADVDCSVVKRLAVCLGVFPFAYVVAAYAAIHVSPNSLFGVQPLGQSADLLPTPAEPRQLQVSVRDPQHLQYPRQQVDLPARTGVDLFDRDSMLVEPWPHQNLPGPAWDMAQALQIVDPWRNEPVSVALTLVNPWPGQDGRMASAIARNDAFATTGGLLVDPW